MENKALVQLSERYLPVYVLRVSLCQRARSLLAVAANKWPCLAGIRAETLQWFIVWNLLCLSFLPLIKPDEGFFLSFFFKEIPSSLLFLPPRLKEEFFFSQCAEKK